MMKKKAGTSKGKDKSDWAAEVRKLKPQLNALSDEDRQKLMAEALTLIHGTGKKAPHGSGC